MVSVLKDEEGKIYAFTEWRLLNKHGFAIGELDHIFVKDLWIHPAYRKTTALKNLIYEIDSNPVGKDAKYVYWNNLRHNKISRTFIRNKARTKGVKRCG